MHCKFYTTSLFLAIFLFISLCLIGKKSYALEDSLFYARVNQFIYTNTFDSAEILLRNKLSEDHLSKEHFLGAHIHLAKLYLKLNDTMMWRKEVEFSKDFLKSRNNPNLLKLYFAELSQQYFTLQKFDSASYFGNRFLQLPDAQGYPDFGHVCLVLGYTEYAANKPLLSAMYYEQAENFFLASNRQCELPLVYNKQALLLAQELKYTDALSLTNRSLRIADSCQIEEYRSNTYHTQVEIYTQQGMYKEAFEIQKKWMLSKDLLNEKFFNYRQHEIRNKYNLEEQGRKLSEAERDSLLKRKSINYLYILIAILLLLLGLLFFYFQKNRRANLFIQEQTNKLKQQNTIIEDTLKQKDFLYRELNHRIKNNLQLITSMLNLQDRYSHHNTYHDLIGEINQKINTIALTYAKMYVDGRKTNDIINLKEYINEIAQNVLNSISTGEIKLKLHCKEVSTNLDIAIPIGLITNELITNSVKHAFAGVENPEIALELVEQNETIFYSIKDNGIGIDENFNLQSADSLGSKIIFLLSQQIKAKLSIVTDRGTQFTFEIKNPKTRN